MLTRLAIPLRLLLVLALLALAAPGQAALLPAATPSSAAAPTAAPAQIDATRTAGEDQRIAQRIAGIFAEVPSLTGVKVAVQQGVVTLSGTVADVQARDRAGAIAARVTGVVTVENTIQRDLSVDGAGGIGTLADKAHGVVRILPLLGMALLVALAIAAFGYLLASLTGLWRRVAPNSFLADLIASAIRFAFVIGGIVVALDMLGASTLLGAVLGGAGVIGIALGFAMRDTVENYVASLMLSVRQPFRANDWVVIDAHEGRVIRLTSRATILMTLDGNHLRIPNGQVFKAVILNYTRNPQRRFEFQLGIGADDDPNAARGLGREALAKLPFVLADPGPEARVVDIGDSNIVLIFLAWIDQREADWYKARSRAIAAVKSALEQAGFAIPEPIYRLRFDPHTPPLPITRASEVPAKAPASAPAHKGTEGDHKDVKPDEEVARMVAAERAATPESEADLLDPNRPVE